MKMIEINIASMEDSVVHKLASLHARIEELQFCARTCDRTGRIHSAYNLRLQAEDLHRRFMQLAKKAA